MPINDTTTNRGYQKPNVANQLSYDVNRLRLALDSIDADMQNALNIPSGTVTSAMIADGTIVNGDISTNANIAHSKLASITAGSILMGNATNIPTATAVTGDVTITNAGVTAIASGVIVDADISASAVIAHSKLANLSSGSILLGNASNVPTATAVTGDITIGNTGVTAIASGVIIDADINANAAIAHTKLANITAGRILMGNASNVPTATVVTGDVTITSGGVTAIASGVITPAKLDRTYASAAFAYFCSSF